MPKSWITKVTGLTADFGPRTSDFGPQTCTGTGRARVPTRTKDTRNDGHKEEAYQHPGKGAKPHGRVRHQICKASRTPASPWKSGASAPRKADKIDAGFSPC